MDRREILGVGRHDTSILYLMVEELSSLLMKRKMGFKLRKVEGPVLYNIIV